MARAPKPTKPPGNVAKPFRLVCVIEGHGEVAAVPRLCTKILHHLEAWRWIVDPEPIRSPRTQLVDKSSDCGQGLSRMVQLAFRRPADAVIVLCDADDGCAATWGPRASTLIRTHGHGAAVMASREYETWLLLARTGTRMFNGRTIENIRDAKGTLARVVPDYKPTVHQARLSSEIDVAALCALSPSFHKLVRSVQSIVDTVM